SETPARQPHNKEPLSPQEFQDYQRPITTFLRTYREPYRTEASHNLSPSAKFFPMAPRTKNRKPLADVGNIPSATEANIANTNIGVKAPIRKRRRSAAEIKLGDGVSMDTSSVTIREEEDSKGYTIV